MEFQWSLIEKKLFGKRFESLPILAFVRADLLLCGGIDDIRRELFTILAYLKYLCNSALVGFIESVVFFKFCAS